MSRTINFSTATSGMAYVDNFEYEVTKAYINQYGGYYIDNYSLNRIHNTEGYADDLFYYRNATRSNYYRKDHLGNNREVWKAERINYSGVEPAKTVQRTQYYPSGLPLSESMGSSTQPYKYNGKEFVEMHGLDETVFDWRTLYNAIVRTPTPDLLMEKHYDISPYAWCGNNPVNRIDPDGMDDVYSREGKFIKHNDNEIDKRTDHIVIRDQNFVKQALIAGGLGDSKDVKAMPDVIDTQLESTLLSAKSYSNIFTDILSDMNDVNMSDLANGTVSIVVSPDDKYVIDKYNNPSTDRGQYASENKSDGKTYITASINYGDNIDNRFMFSTVSNVRNSLGVHEKIGHGQMGIGEESKFNVRTYQLQFNHPTWRNTTDAFKNVIIRLYKSYINSSK